MNPRMTSAMTHEPSSYAAVNRTLEIHLYTKYHWSDYNMTFNGSDGSYEDNETEPNNVPTVVKALEHYAVPVICFLGIIGDVISLFVFVCTSFRYQPCSQYLAALAFVDTLFLISKLLLSFMPVVPSMASAPGSCFVIVYISYVCSFLSAWFVVLMMTERNIVVCYPFRASAMCNKKKSIVVILVTTVFALILYSHSFFTTERNGKVCTIDHNYFEFLGIFTYVDSFLVFVVPFLSIVCLNLRIILTVRKFRLRHDLLNHSIRRTPRYQNSGNTLTLAQVRSTKMLIWVSSVYIVLYLPSYVVRLYGLILVQISLNPDHFYVTQSICQFLYYLNFGIDFIVYVMTSNNFRRNVARCARTVHMTRAGCKYRYKY
ncbi:unnamed protein product [Lymnaea stagnalis]|uniref:G-protein coupled receptors family 1 profile domain-containing protein n=1 Tax=Lymnaea stagnalis TaxID=6523 RepID=A0AAV2HAN6_LYMST